jgi:hypothetical protein
METWKHLEEKYSISNFGRIRNDERGTFLKPFLKGKHSARVRLTLENASRFKTIYIASEVVRNFITTDFKKIVRIDGNVFNNNVDNLKVY